MNIPKRLRMFAGPNGSGKTSLARLLGKEFSSDGLIQLYHFINADVIFRSLQEGTGISLDQLGVAVSVDEARSAVLAGGRLAADHPFLASMQVRNGYIIAPAAACDGYVAAALADFIREKLLHLGRSFSFETVMSHPSKVNFFSRARGMGYRTYLYFIATESSVINVHRVETRMALGGHDVPESKVRERYQRCLQLAGDALALSHRAFVFDNSGPMPVWLAQVTPEKSLELQVPEARLPAWFKTWIAPRYDM